MPYSFSPLCCWGYTLGLNFQKAFGCIWISFSLMPNFCDRECDRWQAVDRLDGVLVGRQWTFFDFTFQNFEITFIFVPALWHLTDRLCFRTYIHYSFEGIALQLPPPSIWIFDEKWLLLLHFYLAFIIWFYLVLVWFWFREFEAWPLGFL